MWLFARWLLGMVIVMVSAGSTSPTELSQNLIRPRAILGQDTSKLLKQFRSSTMWPPTNDQTTEMYEWELRLFNEIFEKRAYSNRVRPARAHGPVNVSLTLVLLKINEILEIDQEINISGFLKLNWTDFRLAWEPSDFGEITQVISEVANIWLPDLALINSDDVYALTRDGRFPVTIDWKGSLLYVPAGKINSRCELNLQFFPFDHQTCSFRFESWVYNENFVKVIGGQLLIDDSHFIQNPQWALLDSFSRTTTVEYDNADFSRVEFFILLQRKSLFFLTYTVLPCGLISYLQMFSHILPLTESERVNFGTTTLIAFAVFHISVVEQVPKSSESIPLLAIYVDSLMALIGMSLMESFIMLNWLASVGYSVPPPAAWFVMVEQLGPYLFLGQMATHWRKNYLNVLAKTQSRYHKVPDYPKALGPWILSEFTTINSRYLLKLLDKYGVSIRHMPNSISSENLPNIVIVKPHLFVKKQGKKRRYDAVSKNICPKPIQAESDDELQRHELRKIATKGEKRAEKSVKEYESKVLTSISTSIDEIKGAIHYQSLKRECHNTWTVFITAIDRVVSLILLIICSLIPIYLFIIYPRTPVKDQFGK